MLVKGQKPEEVNIVKRPIWAVLIFTLILLGGFVSSCTQRETLGIYANAKPSRDKIIIKEKHFDIKWPVLEDKTLPLLVQFDKKLCDEGRVIIQKPNEVKSCTGTVEDIFGKKTYKYVLFLGTQPSGDPHVCTGKGCNDTAVAGPRHSSFDPQLYCADLTEGKKTGNVRCKPLPTGPISTNDDLYWIFPDGGSNRVDFQAGLCEQDSPMSSDAPPYCPIREIDTQCAGRICSYQYWLDPSGPKHSVQVDRRAASVQVTHE